MGEDTEENDDLSDNEVMEESDQNRPSIRITTELKRRLRKPWRNEIIVKLIGRSIGYNMLCSKVRNLLRLQGDFEVLDLSYDFDFVKFDDDCITALTGGPWMIFGHYLSVQKWRPNFQPSIETISTASVWVRFDELPLEYYDEEVLTDMAKLIGKPIKMDHNTAMATRGKYARFCVELNLRNPLLAKIHLGKIMQRIEYEGLHTICFYCGADG